MYNPASALSLNQLNAIIAFDSCFKSLSVSCHLPILKKKDPISPQLGECSCVSGTAK